MADGRVMAVAARRPDATAISRVRRATPLWGVLRLILTAFLLVECLWGSCCGVVLWGRTSRARIVVFLTSPEGSIRIPGLSHKRADTANPSERSAMCRTVRFLRPHVRGHSPGSVRARTRLPRRPGGHEPEGAG
ncbi:hypothetical protein GCM10010406_38900 [Streptomyces thermolineatus]|uniref:Uncharacterized protein n=1 Tax=Streptomyces thermolineatus TaxID=44033 RepID=A0ABN3MAN0_9ACTN